MLIIRIEERVYQLFKFTVRRNGPVSISFRQLVQTFQNILLIKEIKINQKKTKKILKLN